MTLISWTRRLLISRATITQYFRFIVRLEEQVRHQKMTMLQLRRLISHYLATHSAARNVSNKYDKRMYTRDKLTGVHVHQYWHFNKQSMQLVLTNPCDAFRGQSRSPTKHITSRYVRYGFLLVFCSNFVPNKTHRFSDIRLVTTQRP